MAVEMHWVREGIDGVNHQTNRFALIEIINVPLRIVWIRGVTQICKKKKRMAKNICQFGVSF